jgi:hypothetical protein
MSSETSTSTPKLESSLADAIRISSDEAKMAVLNLLRGRSSAFNLVSLLVERASHLSVEESSQAAADYLEDIHTGLSDLAANAPITHPHIVDIISLLHERPEEVLHAGFLGTFGMQHGDYHRYLEHTPSQSEQYINIDSFEARLWTRLGRDFAREVTSDPIEKLSRSVEAEFPNTFGPQTDDAKIATGAVWMLQAGPTIWKFSLENDRDEIGNQFRGPLWKGEQEGYSLARWEFWLQRFDAISRGEGPEVTEETRGYASAASRVMRELQKAT